MQKNLYDYSTLIWSPQGKLYQVEYAMEAVNQGNCLLGLRSDDYVVLCGLKSKSHETLSYHQEKLFKVSQHLGIGVAGLTPDGKNIAVSVVGKNQEYTILSSEELARFFEADVKMQVA